MVCCGLVWVLFVWVFCWLCLVCFLGVCCVIGGVDLCLRLFFGGVCGFCWGGVLRECFCGLAGGCLVARFVCGGVVIVWFIVFIEW